MESQVKTHKCPYGVCGGQIDTKEDFLSEQSGIMDFKISPITISCNRHIADRIRKGIIFLHL